MRTDHSFHVSSNSKSKLNSFRYIQNDEPDHIGISSVLKNHNKTHDPDKENRGSWVDGGVEDKSPFKSQPSKEKQEIRAGKDCPQTPANRIPLADLISNTEDAFKLAPGKEATPEDHVYWQHVPRSSDPNSGTPIARGKKRRHSSSPTSSPLQMMNQKESFDMHKFHSLLKTPQNDMVADLWNNYVGKTRDEANTEIPPRLAALLSSSPQTPGSGKTSRESALRRTSSCGTDWPTSNAKRRKLGHKGDDTISRDLFARAESDVQESSKSRTSKLTMLLDKIQESLNRSRSIQSDIITEIPTGSKGNAHTIESMKEGFHRNHHEPDHKHASQDDSNQLRSSKGKELSESFSEFGDDELDDDLLQLVEDPTSNEQSTGLQVKFADPLTYTQQTGRKQSPTYAAQINDDNVVLSLRKESKTDEFDDDDYDDEFAENVEEIMLQYDHQDSFPARKTVPNKFEQDVRTKIEPNLPDIRTAEDLLKPSPGGQVADMMLSDEFDDKDLDLAVIGDSILQCGTESGKENIRTKQSIKRYLIVNIAESTYQTSKGRTQPELVLLVEDERTQQKRGVILRESWFDTPCTRNSYIHLIGDFDAQGQCVVNNSENMIILHPDHLISATVVADAIGCQRRAVLQDRVQATSDVSRPQVYGHILHEVFQEAMKSNRWDLDWMRKMVDNVLVKYVESLYAIHATMAEAAEYIMSKMPDFIAWATMLVKRDPAGPVVEDRNGAKASLCINKLLEVEEHIWSPMYGLKGNVDATVQVAYEDDQEHKTLTVPLELKTGKKETINSHRAQTALYTLLLSDRYDIDVTFGLLYYLETARTFRIQGVRHELIQMIQQRNRLACFVREKVALPPMLKKTHLCNQCYAKTTCFVYHKLMEDGDGESSGMAEKFDQVVGHLNAKHKAFFTKWDDLLTKEEKDILKFRRELWTMLSTERESLGRCFSNVIIEPGSTHEEEYGPKINRFRYTFIKRTPDAHFSFTESQIAAGEPILVSDEKGHFGLANGYVMQVSSKRITVVVDRRLHNTRLKGPNFHPVKNQTFRGIMDISGEHQAHKDWNWEATGETALFRLDKDEFSKGMATVRNNLICMMEKDLFEAEKLRKLIIDQQAPSFREQLTHDTISLNQGQLNVDQKRAIEKVMAAENYALVLGMPGTGKTTTVAHIIRALVAQGKSVLLTSYTHTAVDNILLKIRDLNIRILRLGAIAKVHPDVQEFADLAAIPKKTIEELQESYEKSAVVATTCLGVNHSIFRERIFDYCIVDEASQITLPVCLGPIRMARTFILVGDHYQLPPLVRNKEAQEGGLDISLFKLLSEAQPTSVVNLEHQYRMCEEIMLLSNNLIYSGRLKCGTPEVASRSLVLPKPDDLLKHHPSKTQSRLHANQGSHICTGTDRCWIRDLVDPRAKTRLVNTDSLSKHQEGYETVQGAGIVNIAEAIVCAQLVDAFVSSGISPRDIGVITFYRSQLSLLRHNLRRYSPDLEMHTTDKFQGRDKEIVILSCVRSNTNGHVGELLQDWRRVNVAFTRARTKLLVIGSKQTLHDGNELLKKYVQLVETHGWVYNLPGTALGDHTFEDFDDTSLSTLQNYSIDPMTEETFERCPASSVTHSDREPKYRAKLSPSTKEHSQVNKTRSPLSPLAQGRTCANSSSLSPSKGPSNKNNKVPMKRGIRPRLTERMINKNAILRDLVNDTFGDMIN